MTLDDIVFAVLFAIAWIGLGLAVYAMVNL